MEYKKSDIYNGEGKINPKPYKEQVSSLTGMVYSQITKKYGDYNVLDTFEEIIKEIIDHEDKFICSSENIGNRIIVVHDVKDNPIASLLVGVYHQYRNTVLDKLSQRLSQMIYETGMKEEITEAMFLIIIKEMKKRFSDRKSGYIYSGSEGEKNSGIIKRK
jgi:hypothetical protein